MADVIVLAEDAMQVAAGEKDGTAAFGAADYRLLPHVQSCAGNDGSEAYAAAAKAAVCVGHVFRSVYAAAMRADVTECHDFFLLSTSYFITPCLS